jgi:hypothetical protein
MYDESGIELPSYLEVDISYFTPMVDRFGSNQARVVELKTAGKTTSELSPRELKRARYGGPRGGSPQIGRN